MHRLLVPALCVLLLTSCGSDREVSNAVKGDGRGSGQPDVSSDSFQNAMPVYLDRLHQRVVNTATQVQANTPDNRVRRASLMWQIRTGETLMGASHQKNLVVALVQTWYWTASMERFFSVGRGGGMFGPQQATVMAAATDMRTSSEELAARYLPPKQFNALKADIESAVGNGDLFAATGAERNQTMDKILSATRLESVLGIALSPFEAMTGVGKGADALKDMTVVGNRAVDLAERYPEMIGWYLQLAAIEIQEQDALRGALADVHSLSETGRALGETAKALPTRIRQEAEALLAASGPVQADSRATLDKVHDASLAVAQAGAAIDQSIRSLDAFVTNAKGPPAKPGDPPGEPFRIQDYAAACQAAEGAARQITVALNALSQAVQSPQTRQQIEGLMRDADQRMEKARIESEVLLAAARTQADQLLDKAGDDAHALIDHAAKRLAQLLVLLAALVAVVVITVRLVRRR